MKYVNDRALDDVLVELERRGWEIDAYSGKHVKAYHPGGGFIVCARTPSCHRAALNTRAKARRLERANSRKEG
jgi:predicted RNA binding protein YcfA (HicA-like mRNA interferase family)